MNTAIAVPNVKVTRSQIEAKLGNHTPTSDKFIQEISAQPGAKSIRYKFFIHDRKDTTQVFVVDSVSIRQRTDIDPVELQAAFLLLDEQRRSVKRPNAASSQETATNNAEGPDEVTQALQLVNALLVIHPNNASLQIIQKQLETGEELIDAQKTILAHLQNQVASTVDQTIPAYPPIVDKMKRFLEKNDNNYIAKMFSLATKGVDLTQTQFLKIDEIIDGTARFDVKYAKYHAALNVLNRSSLSDDQRRRFGYLRNMYIKARTFTHFYDLKTEQSFIADMTRLQQELNVLIP